MARRSTRRGARPKGKTPRRQSVSAGKAMPARISLPHVSAQTLAWFLIGLHVAICAVISFGYWQFGGYGVETDTLGGYLPQTRNMLRGDFSVLDGFKGPGYHMAVALVSIVVRDLLLSAKVVALSSAGIVLALLFHVIRRRIGHPEAWCTIALVALNAQFALYTIQVGTDMYFLALAMAAAVLILDGLGIENLLRCALIAGVLAGLAYLTRYNGIFLVLGGVFLFLLDGRQRGKSRIWPPAVENIKVAGLFLVASAATVLPWSLLTWSKGLGFFHNRNYVNIAYEMFGRDRVSWDHFWAHFSGVFQSFGDVLSGRLGTFLPMVFSNAVEHLQLDVARVLAPNAGPFGQLFAVLWAAMMALGLTLAIRVHRWRIWPVALLGLLSYGVLIPVFYGERFSLPMLPIYALLAALPAGYAIRSWSMPQRLAPMLVLIAIAFSGAGYSADSVQGLLDSIPKGAASIARQMDGKLRSGSSTRRDRLIARKPHLAYFLGLENAGIPMIQSVAELPDIARERHARYLLVSGVEARLRPPLRILLNPADAPSFLKPIATSRVRNYPAVLYEFTIDIPPAPDHDATAEITPKRPPEAPVAVRLGRAYLLSGRRDLAIEEFRRALRQNPDEPTAHLAMVEADVAYLDWIGSRTDMSASDRAKSLRMWPNIERQLVDLKGRFESSHEVQFKCGEILETRGKITIALAAYRRAVALDSTDKDARAALARLLGNPE